MKTCKSCEREKPLSEYNKRANGSPYTMCRVCYASDLKTRAAKRYREPDDATRSCKNCLTEKPILDFPRNANSAGGYLPICKVCYSVKNAKAKWGIDNIYEYIDGKRCEICNREVTIGRGYAIDHDHRCCGPSKACQTCIRGILCNECNQGIGKLGDSIGLLESAISYLRKYGSIY